MNAPAYFIQQIEKVNDQIQELTDRKSQLGFDAQGAGINQFVLSKIINCRKFGKVSPKVNTNTLYEALLVQREGPASRSASATGFVYFVHFKNTDRLKIGFTERLETRLKSLTNAGGEQCYLLQLLAGSRTLEYFALRSFASWKAQGEWFHITPESLAHIDRFVSEHMCGQSLRVVAA